MSKQKQTRAEHKRAREVSRREQFFVLEDLTPEDQARMKELYAAGVPPVDLAGEFDTDMATVFQVLTGARPREPKKGKRGTNGSKASEGK